VAHLGRFFADFVDDRAAAMAGRPAQAYYEAHDVAFDVLGAVATDPLSPHCGEAAAALVHHVESMPPKINGAEPSAEVQARREPIFTALRDPLANVPTPPSAPVLRERIATALQRFETPPQ